MHSFIKLSVVYQFDLLSDFHLTLPQEVVISVLMKLAGGCPSLADQLNVDAFLEQARSYDKASSSPIGWYIRWAAAHADNIKWIIIINLLIDALSTHDVQKCSNKATFTSSACFTCSWDWWMVKKSRLYIPFQTCHAGQFHTESLALHRGWSSNFKTMTWLVFSVICLLFCTTFGSQKYFLLWENSTLILYKSYSEFTYCIDIQMALDSDLWLGHGVECS